MRLADELIQYGIECDINCYRLIISKIAVAPLSLQINRDFPLHLSCRQVESYLSYHAGSGGTVLSCNLPTPL